MTNVDYENLCGVLEALSKVEDEVLNMERHPQRKERQSQNAFMQGLDI
jgi:hypothetical protein